MIRWLWATFEPNSEITNPNRCDAKLYGACLDVWGTTLRRPYGKGQSAQQSPQLQQAMAAAHLNPALSNYFLTGAKAEFVSGGKPTLLGNSFGEFNQGVPPGKSSCITCHQYAAFDGKRPATGHPKTISESRPRVGLTSGMRAIRTETTIALQWSPAPRRRTFMDAGFDAV